MGGGGQPSGGIYEYVGDIGDMPTKWFPNSRLDMRNKNNQRIQQAWYNAKGEIERSRDYKHGNRGNKHTFPHDHKWQDGVRDNTNLPVEPWIN